MGRRSVVALVFAVGAAALAAGILAARGGGGRGGVALEHGPPGLVARGKFHALGWGTSGTVSLIRPRGGGLILRFDRAFHTENAPDLWVRASRVALLHGAPGHTIAPLRRSWGSQEYRVPSGTLTSPREVVTIFCGKCDRAFGAAPLVPAGQR